MADRYGDDLRRLLRSADRFSDVAMARGVRFLKTAFSRSSASLVSVTRPDQRVASSGA
jgi:hypothetical protein